MYLGFSFNRILSVHTDRIATSGLRISKASIFALVPGMSEVGPYQVLCVY